MRVDRAHAVRISSSIGISRTRDPDPHHWTENSMTAALFIVVVVVATALVFDFTNGFHDSSNAMATSVATGAFTPKRAVLVAAEIGRAHV